MNVDKEFEKSWSFGERLADGIARFGGSWTFILCFGAFLHLHDKLDHLLSHQWDRLVQIQEVQLDLLSAIYKEHSTNNTTN